MKYIWINPVAKAMYAPGVLSNFLWQHEYEPVEVTGDWLSIVREKYRLAVERAKSPVADVRCPKIRELLDAGDKTFEITVPDIPPILIHCALELSEREDLRGKEKIITTPCRCLADLGNSLALEDMYFLSWNAFLDSLGDHPKGEPPKSSPIPPGFFEPLGLKTDSVSGEKEIKTYLSGLPSKEVQLVEMLYCKEGCHNGDGIIKCHGKNI